MLHSGQTRGFHTNVDDCILKFHEICSHFIRNVNLLSVLESSCNQTVNAGRTAEGRPNLKPCTHRAPFGVGRAGEKVSGRRRRWTFSCPRRDDDGQSETKSTKLVQHGILVCGVRAGDSEWKIGWVRIKQISIFGIQVLVSRRTERSQPYPAIAAQS